MLTDNLRGFLAQTHRGVITTFRKNGGGPDEHHQLRTL